MFGPADDRDEVGLEAQGFPELLPADLGQHKAAPGEIGEAQRRIALAQRSRQAVHRAQHVNALDGVADAFREAVAQGDVVMPGMHACVQLRRLFVSLLAEAS